MTRPDDQAAHCIKDALAKVPQLDPAEVDDVYMGCANPAGVHGNNIGRVAAMLAGLPVTTSGATINRHCSSGLNAIALAAYQIMNDGVDAAIGGGTESVTMSGMYPGPGGPQNPRVLDQMPALFMAMGDTAEVVAKRYKVSRQSQDEYSLESQLRCAAAQERGFFDEEIAPMNVTYGVWNKEKRAVDGTAEGVCDKDECNRPTTTLEGLLGLPPAFDKKSGEGSITAGNSSQLSDGASATLLMSRDRAEALGIKPKLIFRGFTVAGCEADEMGIGPVFAIPKLLKVHGLKIDDIDRWELNEAFAVQVVYCAEKLGIDHKKLNVNGGSVAIGHPFGMTGSRMVGTLANQLAECGGKYGVVTMCIGGGQGAAGLFENCS
jgi:acetyl-CoA acyltransferase